MSFRWNCEDLHKSTEHIIADTLILLILVGSYIPQIRLILLRRSTSGISQSYILYTYLFTATQFTLFTIYSSWGRGILDCIRDRKLKGLDAYGQVIGWVQMTVLWIGSMLLLLAFLKYIDESRTGDEPLSAAGHSNMNQGSRYPKTILSLCVLHACIWVFPAIAICVQRRFYEPFHPYGFFFVFCDFLLIPVCIVLVASIFPFQIKELLFAGHQITESSLSPTTLALQMIAGLALAWSWKLYVGRPGDPFNIIPPGATQPWVIYRLGAWQWVNNLIFGVGQGALLLIYLWVRSRQRTLEKKSILYVDETSALL